MHTKLSLTLSDATAIVDAAEAYAAAHDLKVSIAVVDEAAHPQHLIRMDGAPYLSADGAIAKARTAADSGHPTTWFEDVINAGRSSALTVAMVTTPPLYPVEGGLPLMVDGQCVGAIGVAGVLPHVDAAVAEAGARALAGSYVAAPASDGA